MCGLNFIFMSGLIGHISQIIGPVVDVHFDLTKESEGQLPAIYEALNIRRPNGKTLIVEVQQHIGEDTVRAIAMDSTDGLSRGLEVFCSGGPITMPVGTQIRGRVIADITIDLPFPRDRSSREFVEYRNDILNKLHFAGKKGE